MRLAEFLNGATATQTMVLREDGRALISTTQDTAPILEANHQARLLYDRVNERTLPGGFRWVARLPAVTVLALNRRGIMRGAAVIDQQRFDAFIDDIEHRKFRTDNGRRLRNLK